MIYLCLRKILYVGIFMQVYIIIMLYVSPRACFCITSYAWTAFLRLIY